MKAKTAAALGQFQKRDQMEEIAKADFIEHLVMPTPLVGQMHHAGQVGIGLQGDRGQIQPPAPVHWEPWNDASFIHSQNSHHQRIEPTR